MPEKKATTHTLMNKALVLYRRENSSVWQCRYKVDGVWQRHTTKESNRTRAEAVARDLMISAEIRKRDNLPVVTRRFRNVANLAVSILEEKKRLGDSKSAHDDYIRIIKSYLIPILGRRMITSIDQAAIDYLDTKRIELMGKAPSKSTLQSQNAALNFVFKVAVSRGLLNEFNVIKLESDGKKSRRRPAFELDEIIKLRQGYQGWINSAPNDKSRESRSLMCDYVEALIDTGARPGKELLSIRWRQIRLHHDPLISKSDNFEFEDINESTKHDLRRSVMIPVAAKGKERELIGMNPTVKALSNIASRNYPKIKQPLINPLEHIATKKNDDYVFRISNQEDVSGSFPKMFDHLLEHLGLLTDSQTGQKRSFYSLRHTYATFKLTHDKVGIHTLAVQMGTSVQMIEKHYSHLKVFLAKDQLRGEKTRELLGDL